MWIASRWLGSSVLALVVVLGLCTVPSNAASPVVPGVSDLVPKLLRDGVETGFVTGGQKALYTATWTDESNATITNTSVVVTLPPGSVLVSADPDVCTASVDPSGSVIVFCPRENMHSGDTLTQQVLFQTAPVTAETQFTVTSFLQGKEQGSDANKSHTDTFPAMPDQPLTISPTAADVAGGCTRFGDETLATQSGLTAANPLITTASLTGPTGTICAPVTLVERHRTSPIEACGAGATCTTDIASTEAPTVSAPSQLTFTFVANNRNLTWYKNGVEVADCPGATQLPDDVHACVNSRAKIGPMAVALGVLWGGGPDPFWAG